MTTKDNKILIKSKKSKNNDEIIESEEIKPKKNSKKDKDNGDGRRSRYDPGHGPGFGPCRHQHRRVHQEVQRSIQGDARRPGACGYLGVCRSLLRLCPQDSAGLIAYPQGYS